MENRKPETQFKSAEEILHSHIGYLSYYKDTSRFIAAMEEYASQFKSQLPIKEEQNLSEVIEFIKGAFQCYVGYEKTDGLENFLKESKFQFTRKGSPIDHD